ncbi:hypothetical protein ABMY26_00525 (plasmid) [Azospirillum sp. HJ39]|uniref:hypothetical protein n=1 Tax=Azospirillum sp. HJ39 TaxID=3159496 RepID=UPI003558AD03
MAGPLIRYAFHAAGLVLTIAVCLFIGGASACGLIYAATNLSIDHATKGFPFIAAVDAGGAP